MRSSGISGSDCKIDGVTYSLWVKDSKGSYYYEGDEGDMVSYADAEKLPAGTYTVQLTDKMDSEPNQSTKIYDSYTAKVQTPAEYFVGKGISVRRIPTHMIPGWTVTSITDLYHLQLLTLCLK